VTQPPPERGEKLTTGLLFRRIPNWQGFWDSDCGLPLKQAFNPGRDKSGAKETGISTYLQRLTNVDEVLEGHNPAFGVVLIDIAEVLSAVGELRNRMGGKKGVPPFGEFSVIFEPSTTPEAGAAGHAHCWMDPVPASVQKELVRFTSPARVVRPCGHLRAQ
jgi:hypothetical protein